MSSGLVICSVCRREVHQNVPPDNASGSYRWSHCEDQTPRCDGASSIYPTSRAEIVGRFCGCDGPPPGGRP